MGATSISHYHFLSHFLSHSVILRAGGQRALIEPALVKPPHSFAKVTATACFFLQSEINHKENQP